MKTSSNAHAVMHYFESCRLTSYPDPATGGAPWTIGWGDTGPDVVKGLTITQDEADARFAARLAREFAPGVAKIVAGAPMMHQCEFDGMVCLAYNIGLGNFRGSTLVRKFNAGDTAGAAAQFLVWNKAAGREMLGLRRRRAAEQALFMGKSGAEAIEIGKAVE